MSEELLELEEEEYTSQLTAPTFKRIMALIRPHWRWMAGFLTAIIFTVWSLHRTSARWPQTVIGAFMVARGFLAAHSRCTTATIASCSWVMPCVFM